MAASFSPQATQVSLWAGQLHLCRSTQMCHNLAWMGEGFPRHVKNDLGLQRHGLAPSAFTRRPPGAFHRLQTTKVPSFATGHARQNNLRASGLPHGTPKGLSDFPPLLICTAYTVKERPYSDGDMQQPRVDVPLLNEAQDLGEARHSLQGNQVVRIILVI